MNIQVKKQESSFCVKITTADSQGDNAIEKFSVPNSSVLDTQIAYFQNELDKLQQVKSAIIELEGEEE